MSTYTPSIPQPSDIPANSQSQILGNFTSIDDGTNGFARNHVTYTNATVGQRGKHNIVELVQQAAIPSGLASMENTYYAKSFTSGRGTPFTQTETYMTRGASGIEIQMTAGKNSELPDFTTPGGSTPIIGATFLPGGLLLQFGSRNATFAPAAITFPAEFLDNNIVITLGSNGQTTPIWSGVTSTGFNVSFRGPADSGTIDWMAIGRA